MKMYTIGELSKFSGLSVKTLRFYDQENILTPELRNESTGYRYYSEKQIMQVLFIKSLKPFGFSLDDIRNILNHKSDDALLEKLDDRMKVIKEDLNALDQQLSALEYVSDSLTKGQIALSSSRGRTKKKDGAPYPAELSTMPKTDVLYTRYVSQLNVDKLFLERCLELQRMRDEYRLYHAGPLMGIFHDGYDCQFTCDKGDLEICMPIIRPENFNSDVIKTMGGFLTVSTIHVGHYKKSFNAYVYLIDWIEENGYRITGPPIEQYILDPCNSNNINHYITKILFPVQISG